MCVLHNIEVSAVVIIQTEISWRADMSGIQKENDLSFDRMGALSVIHIIHSVWLMPSELITNHATR